MPVCSSSFSSFFQPLRGAGAEKLTCWTLQAPPSDPRLRTFGSHFVVLLLSLHIFLPRLLTDSDELLGGGGPDKVLGVGIYHGLRLGLHGCRSGESAHLPSLWPGSDSRTRCFVWVEFFVGSRTCSEYFFPGSPVFI